MFRGAATEVALPLPRIIRMYEFILKLPAAGVQAPDEQLKSATLELLPMDGQTDKAIAPADQNLFLLVIFPIVLMAAGSILYLVKRTSDESEAPRNGGEKGGLWMMLIGFVLAALAFIYLMIA